MGDSPIDNDIITSKTCLYKYILYSRVLIRPNHWILNKNFLVISTRNGRNSYKKGTKKPSAWLGLRRGIYWLDSAIHFVDMLEELGAIFIAEQQGI